MVNESNCKDLHADKCSNHFLFDQNMVVTSNEMEDIIKDVSYNKFPGLDGICSEHIKFAGQQLPVLSILVSAILVHGYVPNILLVFGNRIQGYINSKRMAVNGMVKRLCKEEEVGYVDVWDSFVGKEKMYVRDGLHLSRKGAAVFAEGLSGAVASGLGKVRYLN